MRTEGHGLVSPQIGARRPCAEPVAMRQTARDTTPYYRGRVLSRCSGRTATNRAPRNEFGPAALELPRNAFTHWMRPTGMLLGGLRRYPTLALIVGASATGPELIWATPREQNEISSSHGSVCT